MMSFGYERIRSLMSHMLLVLASILVALLIGEIILRSLGYRPLQSVPPPEEPFLTHHPLFGWYHVPNSDHIFRRAPFSVRVRINNMGLRDSTYSYAQTDGRKRILILGDSFAWGFGVEQHEMFSERLEANLENIDVINAAVTGYSTDQELLWLEHEGIKYNPNVIVLSLVGNDIPMNDFNLVYGNKYKPRFVLETDSTLRLVDVPVPLPSTESIKPHWLSRKSSFAALIEKVVGRIRRWSTGGLNPELIDYRSRLTSAIIGKIEDVAEEIGACLIVLVTKEYWLDTAGSYEDFVDGLAPSGFMIIDLEQQPGYSTKQMTIQEDGHWNTRGHAFIAKSLQAFMRTNNILSSK